MAHSCIPLVSSLILSQLGTALTSDLPPFRAENGAQQFVVHGKSFLILGGELGNSFCGNSGAGCPHPARHSADAPEYSPRDPEH